MQRFLIALFAGIALATTATGFAQDTKAAGQRPIQEIRKVLTGMEEQFSRGDAKALAAFWTPAGDFTGPAGERVEGRQNIEKAFREFFSKSKGGKLKFQILSVRIASESLALVDAVPDVTPRAAEEPGEAVMSLVLAKHGNQWLIESARENVVQAPSQAQSLKDLQWLVGDWANDATAPSGVSVRCSCDWTANQTFLIRKFQVEGKAGFSRAGTEVIGWDPRQRRIRSWVFDSQGGFGENLWVQDGNRWLVRYSGTQPDGTDASAMNIFTIVDANTVSIQSKDRMFGGVRQPEVPEVTIKRQKPPKDAAKTTEPTKPPQRGLP